MRKYIISLLIAIFCLSQTASAEVFTTQKTEGMGNCIYVAGSPDMYPIEFYDEKEDAYSGMVPEMLNKISEKTGIDFVYINGNKADKIKMGENRQVEIVSCVKNKEGNFADYVELISYKESGEVISVGIGFTDIASKDTVSKIKAAAGEISQAEKNGIILKYVKDSDGINPIWLVSTIALVLLLVCASVIFIVKIRKLKDENAIGRMTDEETGIGNLKYFQYHFRNTIGDISKTLYYVAYIILDSGYLRSYHGENSFEDVLKYTATVLSERVGDRDFVARITENGFAMAIQELDEDSARKRLEEILKKLNNFEEVKENNKLIFHAAVYQLEKTDKNCEILLYNLRKNCNKIFGTEKQIIYCDNKSMNSIQEEKKNTERILKGFENNEFKMYLQFVVDNKTKKITSAEALSRWESSHKGLIGPGQYIGNMESAGLISRHDFYMFDLACRQLEKWNNTEYKDISISCNFTRITLSEEGFIDKLKMISQSYDFDKSKLAIEITEDAMEKNRATATDNVNKCKELGLNVYLDDLGSGYTTLANLCDYPIDVVKIDRDILLKADTKKGKDLLYGIIALAHSLKIKVICEGVETEEQNKLVSDSDCDFIQGWYYSKVFPQEECESFIKKYYNK